MKPATTLKAISAAVALTASMQQAAEATPVTISQTLSLGTLLNGGGSVPGLFDINALAASAGVTGNYEVQAAQVIGYGYSDILYSNSYQGRYTDSSSAYYYSTVGGYYTYYYPVYYSYSYSCGSWGWSTCYAYGAYYQQAYAPYYVGAVNHDIYQSDQYNHNSPGATMEFTAGTAVQTDSSPYSLANTNYGNYSYSYSQYNYSNNGYDYYYLRNVDSYSGAYGPLTAAVALGAADLTNASQTGQIDFNFASLSGRFTANSVSLTATIEAVPEPGTLLVFGASLLALLATRRRKVVELA